MVLRRPLDRPTGTVPVALQQMMWVHTRGAVLRPVATVVTNRTVRQLVDVTGRVLAEVADDRVTARRLGATAVPWRPGAWTTIWATAVLGTVAGRHLPPAVLLLGFSGVMIAAAAALVPRNRRSGGPATDPAAGPGDQATMTRPAARPGCSSSGLPSGSACSPGSSGWEVASSSSPPSCWPSSYRCRRGRHVPGCRHRQQCGGAARPVGPPRHPVARRGAVHRRRRAHLAARRPGRLTPPGWAAQPRFRVPARRGGRLRRGTGRGVAVSGTCPSPWLPSPG
jgi:hypothetical protein